MNIFTLKFIFHRSNNQSFVQFLLHLPSSGKMVIILCNASNSAKKQRKTTEWGNTRDLFKKVGDIKGIFHAKMGTIKDRNSKDLTEAEEIKKRWQEYTEELHKKGFSDQDNHDGMDT